MFENENFLKHFLRFRNENSELKFFFLISFYIYIII